MIDKLKYIKLELEDGSYSEPIPLAVDSDHVDISGDTLTKELDKRPYYYNNIADMKADSRLKVGDMAITLGYYEPNDGGAAEYKIVNGNYTDNGGSYHQLDNDLFAELIVKNNTVAAESFGLKGDGITDNSVQMGRLLAFRENDYLKIVFTQNKVYGMQKEIYFYANTEIDLNQATIKCLYTGGPDDSYVQYAQGLRFYANVESVKVPGYGAIKNFHIYNGTLDGGNSGITFAMLHGDNFSWKNITFYNCSVGTHIVDMGGCSNFLFEDCLFTGSWITGANNYREMLQPDNAGYSNLPYWGNNPSFAFDQLPTKNLIVRHCTFEKGNGTHYPNAIGTHSTSGVAFTENILIENCTFYDCTYSAIRLPHCKNVKILNNMFYNENPNKTGDMYMINLKGLNNNYPGSQDILIKDNTFKSMLGNEIGDDNTVFIGITCHNNANSFCKNIQILDNIAYGTYEKALIDWGTEGSIGAPVHNSQDFLQLNNVESIDILRNKIIQMKQLLYINEGPIHIKNVRIKDNYLENCRVFIRVGDSESYTRTPVKGAIVEDNIWSTWGPNKEQMYTWNLNKASFTYTIPETTWTATTEGFQNVPLVNCVTGHNELKIDSNGMIMIPHYFKRYKIKFKLLVYFNNHYGTEEQVVTTDNGRWYMNCFIRQYENLGIHIVPDTGFSVVPTGIKHYWPENSNGTPTYEITWESPIIDHTQYWTTSKHFYYTIWSNIYPGLVMKRFERNTSESQLWDTLATFMTIEVC